LNRNLFDIARIVVYHLMHTPTAKSRMSELDSVFLDVYSHPGHMLRRAQQIAVSVFYETVGDTVTPIQYAILRLVHDRPGVDQKTLAGLVGIDTSTTAATAERLEAKGYIRRDRLVDDRRQRALFLTDEGVELLLGLVDGVRRMQAELFHTFSAGERETLMALLHKFVTDNNALSRAPLENAGTVAAPPKRPKQRSV
jgi:DNA-binding MarR family transcriptional regulator